MFSGLFFLGRENSVLKDAACLLPSLHILFRADCICVTIVSFFRALRVNRLATIHFLKSSEGFSSHRKFIYL